MKGTRNKADDLQTHLQLTFCRPAVLHGLVGQEKEAWKGQRLEKHLHAQAGRQNKGKLTISPLQMGRLREAWERCLGETIPRSPPDVQRTGANTALGFMSRNPTKLLASRSLVEWLLRDFKSSSPMSPKGIKTPEIPLTQPLRVAKKYCTSMWRLNIGRPWASPKGTSVLLPHARPRSRGGIGPPDSILKLVAPKLKTIKKV